MNNNHSNKLCYNCHKDHYQCSINFYKDEIDTIGNILSNKDIYLKTITYKIVEYIYNTHGHYIDYTQKSRGEVYTYCINVCTKCFQSGIYLSLKKQNRLPFLRNDICYFISENNPAPLSPNELNDLDNKIKKKFKKYIFPSRYSCTYYRQPQPEFINNEGGYKIF